MSGAKQHLPLEPITIRFSPKAMRALEQIAQDNALSKAQVVRLATEGKLYKYLGDVKFLTPIDAKAVMAEIRNLFDATRRAEWEMHRIGVTLNQLSRALNVMAKSGQTQLDGIEGLSLTRQDVEEIIERYEKASGEAGEQLCRILGYPSELTFHE